MSVQYLANLGWYSLDLGVTQSYVGNDGSIKASWVSSMMLFLSFLILTPT
jgi:hypothetical protein